MERSLPVGLPMHAGERLSGGIGEVSHNYRLPGGVLLVCAHYKPSLQPEHGLFTGQARTRWAAV
jgi:hypothetical protein